MRLAAERADWNSCADATKPLLLQLPPLQAVRLTRDFVASRLPAFERQQPGVHWPRNLLKAVTEEAPDSNEGAWQFEDEFTGPGGNNFAKAVESLWIASLLEDEQQRAAELMNALSEAIMTERVEHWGSRYPKEWSLWYQLVWSEEDDRLKTEIQISMLRNPEVMRLGRAGWLEVADRLEAALHQSSGSSGGSAPPP